MTMLSAKKLIKMARGWQKFTAKQRKRISLPRNVSDADSCSVSSSVVEKGHFVVYTIDQRSFVIPLAYLENEVIRQLLNMSEEEFGHPSGCPITLPCDSAFMSSTTSSAPKNGIRAMDVEKYKKKHISRKLRKIRRKLNKLYPEYKQLNITKTDNKN
ncbi:hypothetical protein H5410_052417 [Solanum commersonii]|uniref:Uncharacterized protein n=1 Tax=Solanum commersonii TaxID=4109 RepID=A0A9J5X3K1_SOLCO|nr:hypothetical protein H5410_052417 [Solanum commersonii]